MGGRVFSPVLVGRDAELAQLEAALARASGGDASMVLVAGEAGIGKTRLVEQFTGSTGVTAGVTVWRGRCVPSVEGASPYAPIVDVLRTAVAHLGEDRVRELAGAALPGLARLLPEIDPGLSNPDSSQARQWHDLTWLVNRLVDRPTVMVIEDIHWADLSTRGLLSLLFHNAKGPLLIICTYRDDELPPTHATRSLLAEWHRAGVGRIQLERLDLAATVAQIAAITGRDPDPVFGGDLFRRSGGNPFFVEELLAAGPMVATLPEDLRDVLLLRVRQLPPGATRIVRAVAVAGHAAQHAVVAQAAGLAHDELVAALLVAVDNHILLAEAEHYRFRHALVAEAVLADMIPGQRIQLHRALAEALDIRLAEGGSAPGARRAMLAEAAHQWFQAGEADRALIATIAAGLAAAEVFALAEAHGHFRRALDLWPSAPRGRESASLDLIGLYQRAAETAFLLYDLENALILVRQALLEVDENFDPMRAGLLYALRGRCMVAGGKPIADTLGAYEAAIRLVPDAATPERAHVMSTYSALVMVSSRHAEAAELARDAVEIARRVGAVQAEVRGLATLGNCLVLLGRADEGIVRLREALEIAPTAGEPGLLAGAYINLSDALCNAGQLTAAAETAWQGLEVLEPHSVQKGHYNVLLANALEILFWLGRWDRLAERLAAFGAPAADNSAYTFLWATAAEFHIARGRYGDARQALDACRDAVSGANLELSGHVLAAEAEWSLWQGDPHAAWVSAVQAIDLLGEESSHGPLMAGLLARGARALADLVTFHDGHDLETAVARLGERIARKPPAPNHTVLAEAQLSMARAELARLGEGAASAWQQAAGQWRRLAAPYQMAYSLWRQAEALLRPGGRRRPAARVAGEAYAVASRLGAVPLCREIQALSQRTRLELLEPASSSDVDSPFGLTAREVEVLRLLALGHTNRQIADGLFIAEGTVDNHVSSILAKMDVPSRGAAAAAVRRLGMFDPEA